MADKDDYPRVRISETLLGEGEGLRRVLKRHHLSGIAISGTIGAGLFLTSGDTLAIAGGMGSIIAYACAGVLVMCVMFCLSELVSVRPSPGAFYEYPAIFVHPSLGFASSWAYWLAYACSGCTLTVEAAKLLAFWSDKLAGAGGIAITLAPVVLLNLFGPVIWYGRLEWGVKWVKIILILVITVLMLAIAAGVRGNGAVSIQPPSHQWDDARIFPPGFCFYGAVDGQCRPGPQIPGTLGIFLGIWTSISAALFSFLGLEFVVIAAGEAKYPRHDLPSTVRWIYWFAIVVYIELMILAAVNVPFDDPALRPFADPGFIDVPAETLQIFPYANNTRINTGDRSPFVIAAKRAGFQSVLPDVLNLLLYLSALTAANTAFYVSSRTMYQLCIGGTVNKRIRKTLGSTTYYGLPLWAIIVSVCISSFSFLAAIRSNHNQIKSVVSRISVTSNLCVYLAQCLAFIRYQYFYKMKFGTNRRYKSWPGHEQCYRSGLHQPFPAILAIVFGGLLLFFNGWDTIYQATQPNADPSDIAAGLIKSYLGPVIFAALFFAHKYKHGRTMVTFPQVRDKLDEIANVPKDQSNMPPPDDARWKTFLKAIM